MVTRNQDLNTLRTKLLAALDVVDPADVPKISKELRAVDLEIEALGGAASPGQQLVDQLKAKRERRTASKG